MFQESSNIPWYILSIEAEEKKTERMIALDRIFAFEHVIRCTVTFTVSSASTDIRVYNGTTKFVQQVAMNRAGQNPNRVNWLVKLEEGTDILVSAVLWPAGPP